MNAVSSFALLAVLSAGTSGAPVTSPGDTVLLEFAMQRCQHCQAMQPVVARLTQQGVNVQVVDAEQRADLRARFKVTGVPTFVAVSGGQEIGRIEGVASFEKLADLAQGSTVKAATSGRALHSSELPPDQSARAATVRIKVEDPTGYGFGTGTIIDTHDGEALVVTCGHLFRESKGQGKITADLFASGAPQTVDGQLIAYNLDRDVALISLKTGGAVRPAMVAPPGYTVRPGDRVFTLGCDKGADPSVRPSQITAVNKYVGRPNYTAAGQPVDGRSGGGLFTADGLLIGICNAADPADDEGLYAGLASVHWQLDQIGQSEIYQRAARLASAANPPRDPAVAFASAQAPLATAAPPQLPTQMPVDGTSTRSAGAPVPTTSAGNLAPVAAAGDDTEIVFIVRSKRDPAQRSEVYVVDQAPPDLIARISHAARASGEQRAAVARANQPLVRTAAANPLPAVPPVVRGQSTEN